jgi:hypothetical protein
VIFKKWITRPHRASRQAAAIKQAIEEFKVPANQRAG